MKELSALAHNGTIHTTAPWWSLSLTLKSHPPSLGTAFLTCPQTYKRSQEEDGKLLEKTTLRILPALLSFYQGQGYFQGCSSEPRNVTPIQGPLLQGQRSGSFLKIRGNKYFPPIASADISLALICSPNLTQPPADISLSTITPLSKLSVCSQHHCLF